MIQFAEIFVRDIFVFRYDETTLRLTHADIFEGIEVIELLGKTIYRCARI
jgi:hypothetical protein